MLFYFILGVMAIVFLASVISPNSLVPPRSDVHAAGLWFAIFGLVLLSEVYLLFFRHHSLSEQMQYWVGKGGWRWLFLSAFWFWLAYHLTLEKWAEKLP